MFDIDDGNIGTISGCTRKGRGERKYCRVLAYILCTLVVLSFFVLSLPLSVYLSRCAFRWPFFGLFSPPPPPSLPHALSDDPSCLDSFSACPALTKRERRCILVSPLSERIIGTVVLKN